MGLAFGHLRSEHVALSPDRDDYLRQPDGRSAAGDRFRVRRLIATPPGLVIVGGLIFSQMISPFVTPVIYFWLEWFQEHVLDKVLFLRSAQMHHEDKSRPKPASVIMAQAGSRSTAAV